MQSSQQQNTQSGNTQNKSAPSANQKNGPDVRADKDAGKYGSGPTQKQVGQADEEGMTFGKQTGKDGSCGTQSKTGTSR